MGNEATQLKHATWFDQLEKLRAILVEGHTIATEILGPYPQDAVENKKPFCYVERLDDELAQVLVSADVLVMRLKNISQQF